MLQPVFMFINRMLFSIVAGFVGTQPYCPYLLLVCLVLSTVFVAIIKPYSKRHHYIRGLATQSAAIIVLSLYCVLTAVSDSVYLATFRIIIIVVLVVLFLNLAGNMVFIAISIKKRLNTLKHGNIERERR